MKLGNGLKESTRACVLIHIRPNLPLTVHCTVPVLYKLLIALFLLSFVKMLQTDLMGLILIFPIMFDTRRGHEGEDTR